MLNTLLLCVDLLSFVRIYASAHTPTTQIQPTKLQKKNRICKFLNDNFCFLYQIFQFCRLCAQNGVDCRL